jgi:predicted transposase YdaD
MYLSSLKSNRFRIPSRFYDEGYRDGYEHGRIHGLIEGRALGREKGYEMWEELGFYDGFALMWNAILDSQGGRDEFGL